MNWIAWEATSTTTQKTSSVTLIFILVCVDIILGSLGDTGLESHLPSIFIGDSATA